MIIVSHTICDSCYLTTLYLVKDCRTAELGGHVYESS